MAPRTRIEDKGLEALRSAGRDPIGGFLIRILGPGVRQEVNRVRKRVGRLVDDFTGAIRNVEGPGEQIEDDDGRPVIDAEIVDDEPRR